MKYTYFLENASLTLRVLNYLVTMSPFLNVQVTVIHQTNGWIIRINIPYVISCEEDLNFRAFLSELGRVYKGDLKIDMVFCSLDMGDRPIDVMRIYQVAIVSHGSPDISDVEDFRQQISQGLGYCPQTLA